MGIAAVVFRSAEDEVENLHARVEKLDLELPILNRLRLPDQLIKPLFAHRAVALIVDVEPMSGARRLSVDEHAEANGVAWRCWSHHEMQVAGVETVCDSPFGRIQADGFLRRRPIACERTVVAL